ncbi:MAG: GNAT family N-acetyltransferase [bacterium]|nr:GNAT family N-acetyltransferase [bacterium]
MDIQLIEYTDKYKKQVIKLFEDFQDYLISIDPLKRLRRMPEYGEHILSETLTDANKHKGKFYLLVENEAAIGLVAGLIKEQTDDDLLGATKALKGRVTQLYLDERYRGQGLGKKLMLKIEAYFKENGCNYVLVEVFVPNVVAHSLYNNLGFQDRDIDMIKEL